MSDPTHLSDDEILGLARATAAPTLSTAESARLVRGFEQALADDAVSRRRAIGPAAAAAAVFFAAAAAAAGTAFLVDAATPTPAPVAAPALRAPAPVPALLPAVSAPVLAPAAVPDVPDVVVTPKKARVRAAASAANGNDPVSNPAAARDDLRAAAGVAAAAVAVGTDARAATVDLWGLSGRDPAIIDELDVVIAAEVDKAVVDDEALARVMRLSCELRLRHRRDSAAVAACRSFGQRFPGDRAALPLAFAAGGLAEELGDLDDAIDEYTRSIVLAPFMGGSGADGLLARARVRTRLGELDEARADLRLYLQKQRRPAATHDDEVQGLARALRVELP